MQGACWSQMKFSQEKIMHMMFIFGLILCIVLLVADAVKQVISIYIVFSPSNC